MLNTLKHLAEINIIRPLDYHFARLLAEQSSNPVVLLAAALTSRELGNGHTCLHLGKTDLFHTLGANRYLDAIKRCPPPNQWARILQDESAIGDGKQATPLVLDNGRLYLMRYWQYEMAIAHRLNNSSHTPYTPSNAENTAAILNRLFPEQDDGEINWQKVAAAVAASRRVSVISGGPGTGKTTTVTRLLALLVEQALEENPDRPPVIRLTAPTGKAAARLTESIGTARWKLNCSKEVRYAITDQATTLHRLLGVIPGRTEFRHNRDNPLHLDVLVVDEASMIDASLMARLLDALPETARLIFLGDRDQLASVEAGSVLGDICANINSGYSHQQIKHLQQLTGANLMTFVSGQGPAIRDSLCLLRKSYRFDANSGIGQLARAVNNGDLPQVEAVCQAKLDDLELAYSEDIQKQLLQTAVDGYRPYLEAMQDDKPAEDVLDMFDQFQTLCALREGKWGVAGLNNTIRSTLARKGLIPEEGIWYHGRPVLITRNDPALELYNGDIGITFRREDGRFRVAFPTPDGKVRYLLPSRLPEHETVFAMTVHKSQGSEFRRVSLVLPDTVSPVLTRELLYTGITRAKKSLVLFSKPDILVSAVNHPIERVTGLADRLL
ncbi:exodeoxyribonuclease V subunit alpha [Sansalvadorimonas verongulae]|uniref:exodeoxyribonuclease V subunit alpha n=1 Tax=Sansalvadorimonas verongulae TaxID=2172824 RepID=UPI0012BBFF7A|nr:exodeoxyribonuclease V subunit alpha [Sansalvadorimonas verongulae]MTI14371.1 exodeoxyribonuclease V subunit alpha [Sansalvadorimonas verongulae]